MTDTSFSRKRLQFMIRVDGENFEGSNDKNTVVLENYRANVTIDLAGVDLNDSFMACRIWGMPSALMDKLDTRHGKKANTGEVQRMAIKIAADDGSGQYVDVYVGHVISAFPDYNAAPNVSLEIHASAAYLYLWDAPKANSYKGEFDVAKAIEGLATRMGFSFENHGVTKKLTDQYTSGSTMNQIRALASAAGIACMINNNKVSIWPNGKGNGAPALKLSPKTGLIGYPRWDFVGITVTHLFNQNILNGTEVDLDTSIEAQRGQWFVHLPIRHMLDCEIPGGKWHTEAKLTRDAEVYVRVN